MSVAGDTVSGFLNLNSGLFFEVLNLGVTSDRSVRHTGTGVVARMAKEFRFRNKFAMRNLGDPRARIWLTREVNAALNLGCFARRLITPSYGVSLSQTCHSHRSGSRETIFTSRRRVRNFLAIVGICAYGGAVQAGLPHYRRHDRTPPERPAMPLGVEER
jgi:hypothetical protein